jgi:hypothetical protein
MHGLIRPLEEFVGPSILTVGALRFVVLLGCKDFLWNLSAFQSGFLNFISYIKNIQFFPNFSISYLVLRCADSVFCEHLLQKRTRSKTGDRTYLRSGNALHLYFGSAQFESRPRHRISCLSVAVVFLSLSGQILG